MATNIIGWPAGSHSFPARYHTLDLKPDIVRWEIRIIETGGAGDARDLSCGIPLRTRVYELRTGPGGGPHQSAESEVSGLSESSAGAGFSQRALWFLIE